MGSVEVLLINALLYSVTLLFFFHRFKLSIGTVIWTLYTISAWSTYMFVQQPLYASSVHACEQTLFPCIYLYFVFLISIVPLMKVKFVAKIEQCNYQVLRIIMIVCIFTQAAFIVVDLPSVIKTITTSSGQLGDLRDTIYDGLTLSAITKSPILNRMYNLFSGIRMIATGLSVITFLTVKDDRILVTVFFITTLLRQHRTKLAKRRKK